MQCVTKRTCHLASAIQHCDTLAHAAKVAHLKYDRELKSGSPRTPKSFCKPSTAVARCSRVLPIIEGMVGWSTCMRVRLQEAKLSCVLAKPKKHMQARQTNTTVYQQQQRQA